MGKQDKTPLRELIAQQLYRTERLEHELEELRRDVAHRERVLQSHREILDHLRARDVELRERATRK